MRNTRDTFLHFLADNIGAYYTPAIPVKGVWRRPDKPTGELLQNNAINVSFLGANFDPLVGSVVCVIDVVNSDELVAVDWADALWSLLSATFYTPQMDYSGSAPVPTGTNIMWPLDGVKFRPIPDDYYFRFNCRLTLQNKP